MDVRSIKSTAAHENRSSRNDDVRNLNTPAWKDRNADSVMNLAVSEFPLHRVCPLHDPCMKALSRPKKDLPEFFFNFLHHPKKNTCASWHVEKHMRFMARGDQLEAFEHHVKHTASVSQRSVMTCFKLAWSPCLLDAILSSHALWKTNSDMGMHAPSDFCRTPLNHGMDQN